MLTIPRGGGGLRCMYSMASVVRIGWLCFGDILSLLIRGSNEGLIVSCLVNCLCRLPSCCCGGGGGGSRGLYWVELQGPGGGWTGGCNP